MVNFTSWKQWLEATVLKPGTWANRQARLAWGDFDSILKMSCASFVTNAASSEEQALVLIVEGEGKVRAYHNIRVFGALNDEDVVVGVYGGNTRTINLRLLPEAFTSAPAALNYGTRGNRIKEVPAKKDLLMMKPPNAFKALRVENGPSAESGAHTNGVSFDDDEMKGLVTSFWPHPDLYKDAPSTPIAAEEYAIQLIKRWKAKIFKCRG